ncbi:MAG: UvrB/UvrC motif-containing protein [Candidatus Latescibacteria bacterium]|nr:UvrB/UvrC motif-containing protein [Candidatus Latescibacterota bacterium]
MKQCSLCQKPEVSVVITTIDKDGKACELALCKECASKKGVGEIKKTILAPQEILAELHDKISADDHKLICSSCGLSYAAFTKAGRLGCETCYETFGNKLEAVIKRIHGTTTHIGKSTTNSKKKITEKFVIKKLQASMKNAIAGEDYEKAASIRDRIRKIKEQSK